MAKRGPGSHLEIETKYDVDADVDLPDLSGLPDVDAVLGPTEHDLEATYVDTAELALAAAGVTLRRRTGGDDEGWHLKLPAGNGRHEEHRPLGGSADDVPPDLAAAVQGYVRGAPLAPVTVLRTRRRVRHLRDADGRVLAELADDTVEAEVPSRDGSPDCRSSWREWEVELVDGDRDVLEAAGRLLTSAGASPSASTSKLARALGGRVLRRPDQPLPDAVPSAPAAMVVQARLFAQVAELRRRDPLVRLDVPDSVHKMRVATRRLRSALATYRPFLDRRLTDPLRDDLKELADLLGAARDPEVLHALVHDRLAEQDARSPTAERALDEQYRRAHARVVRALQSPRYYAMLDRLTALAETPPWTERAGEPVKRALTASVAHEWKRTRKRLKRADKADTPDERTARLHDVRKAAKRARYAAEPLVPVLGRDAARFVKATKKVQSVLGDHHDTVEARSEVRRLAGTGTSVDETFALGDLHARLGHDLDTFESRFQKAWAKASRKLHRWLT